MSKIPREDPEYHGGTPERHAPTKAPGTRPDGTVVHGTYKQPWVEHDGVCDPHGDEKIG